MGERVIDVNAILKPDAENEMFDWSQMWALKEENLAGMLVNTSLLPTTKAKEKKRKIYTFKF